MSRKYAVGDWCFHNFELAQVEEVEDGKVIQVSTGIIRSRSSYMECRPLTMPVKRISEEFAYWSKELHKLPKGMNYPDIMRYLEARWLEACDIVGESKSMNESQQKKWRTAYKELEDFCQDVISQATSTRQQEVRGVRIFR